MRHTAPTPKVFNAKYTPPKQKNTGIALPKRPIIIAVAIIVGGSLFTRLPFFQIKTVEIEGSLTEAATTEIMELKGVSIFSSKISRTTNKVLAENTDLAKLDCSRGIPATLHCKAERRLAKFIWNTTGKNYLLDQHGYIFAESSDQLLPTISDRANKPIQIGDNVTSEEIVTGYSSVLEKLDSSGIVTNQMNISESFYQFNVVLTGRKSPDQPFPAAPITAVMTTSYSLDAQVKILHQTLQERSGQIKERIDLRVPGNVYYY